jgi:hypothetical protein
MRKYLRYDFIYIDGKTKNNTRRVNEQNKKEYPHHFQHLVISDLLL